MVGYMAEMVLGGRPVLFVGGGQVALRKVRGVLVCAAQVTILSPELHPTLAKMVDAGQCLYRKEPFRATCLDETPAPALVFAVTGEMALNREIAQQCRQRGLWCNAADGPENSSFLVPAVVRRGPVTLAASTGGCSPALSRLLKERLDLWLEPGWGPLTTLFGALRSRVKEKFPEPSERQAFWRNTCLAVERERRYEEEENTGWLEARISQEKNNGN